MLRFTTLAPDVIVPSVDGVAFDSPAGRLVWPAAWEEVSPKYVLQIWIAVILGIIALPLVVLAARSVGLVVAPMAVIGLMLWVISCVMKLRQDFIFAIRKRLNGGFTRTDEAQR